MAVLVSLILATNLPADLTLRKICRAYVGVGRVGRDRVELFGRYILPRYREDIVRRDISRHRCSRIRCRASRRECSHLRRRELRRRLAQPDDDATEITRLAKMDI